MALASINQPAPKKAQKKAKSANDAIVYSRKPLPWQWYSKIEPHWYVRRRVTDAMQRHIWEQFQRNGDGEDLNLVYVLCELLVAKVIRRRDMRPEYASLWLKVLRQQFDLNTASLIVEARPVEYYESSGENRDDERVLVEAQAAIVLFSGDWLREHPETCSAR
jgi:hypothetical protein